LQIEILINQNPTGSIASAIRFDFIYRYKYYDEDKKLVYTITIDKNDL